jgi:4-hydroxy-3-polyprenylbenzoate decarboxylase
MTTSGTRPIVLAITGASGAAYGVRLLQQLLIANQSVHLIVSPSGAAVIAQELGFQVGQSPERIRGMLQYAWPNPTGPSNSSGGVSKGNTVSDDRSGGRVWVPLSAEQIDASLKNLHVYDYRNFFTPVASGSFRTAAMIICPCSGATLSGVVHAAGNNLIQRAADVHLKEHRKLILVPRETPLSVFQLENMTRAAQAGAILMPAMPGWYHGVQGPVDLIDFVVSRILDHLDIEHTLMKRWGADHPGLDPEHLQSGDA